MPGQSSLHWIDVRRIALLLPGVEEGPCCGTPGLRVRKRVMARLKEDGETLAVKCGDEERDRRLKSDPRTFFVTEHYRGSPTVLVRLSKVSVAELNSVLEAAWRRLASKRMLAEREREK